MRTLAAERYGRGVAKVAMAFVPVCGVALVAIVGSLGSGDYGPRGGPHTRMVVDLAGVAIGTCLLVASGMAAAAAWNGAKRLSLARRIGEAEGGYAGDDAPARSAHLEDAITKAKGDLGSYGLGLTFGIVCVAWIAVSLAE